MASEVAMGGVPQVRAPEARPATPPSVTPGVKAGSESHAGFRGRLEGILGRGRQESPTSQTNINKETGRGIVDAINTGDPKEITAAIQYDRSADTREAAFAARDKHIEWSKAMQEPLDDAALSDSYLDKSTENDPAVTAAINTGDKANIPDAKVVARTRIVNDYRKRAENAPSVTAAINTGDKAAIEDAILVEANRLLVQDAKQEFVRKLEAQKSPDQGLSDLAQGAASTEPALSGVAAEASAATPRGFEPVIAPDGTAIPVMAGGAPRPGEASIVAAELSTQPLTTDEQTELRDLQQVLIPDIDQRTRRDELIRRQNAVIKGVETPQTVAGELGNGGKPLEPGGTAEPTVAETPEAQVDYQAQILELSSDIKALWGNLTPEEIAGNYSLRELSEEYGGDVDRFVAHLRDWHQRTAGAEDLVTRVPHRIMEEVENVRNGAISELGQDRANGILEQARAKKAAENAPSGTGSTIGEPPAAGVAGTQGAEPETEGTGSPTPAAEARPAGEKLTPLEERIQRMEAEINSLVQSNRELQQVVKSMADYIKEDDPKKKESMKKALLALIAAIGLSLVIDTAGEVKSGASTSS